MRLKLRGGLPKTASSVELAPSGDLVVELFDFSEAAQTSFGNDVAFLVTVRAADRAVLQAALGFPEPLPDDVFLATLRENFGSYHEVKAFLEARGVPFTARFDSWA